MSNMACAPTEVELGAVGLKHRNVSTGSTGNSEYERGQDNEFRVGEETDETGDRVDLESQQDDPVTIGS